MSFRLMLFHFLASHFFLKSMVVVNYVLFPFRRNAFWHTIQGYLLLRRGKTQEAHRVFESGIELSRNSSHLQDVRWLHMQQFFYARCETLLGKETKTDPLFLCSYNDFSESVERRFIGVYEMEFVFNGLVVVGFVFEKRECTLSVFLDDTCIMRITTAPHILGRKFKFQIRRPVLAKFPPDSHLAIRCDEVGHLKFIRGSSDVRLSIPHGDGSLKNTINSIGMVSKKGTIRESVSATEKLQQTYLELYETARELFLRELGRELFVLYGTLLGCQRGQDFIPGDDDFDAGFFSYETDSIEVKRDILFVIERIVEAGMVVYFNRIGRLFRLSTKDLVEAGIHIDVHTVWQQDGRIWIQNQYSHPGEISDWIPAGSKLLRDRNVLIPNRPDIFLENNYGSGWAIPDPSFRYFGNNLNSYTREVLRSTLISPTEYRALRNRIEKKKGATNPKIGDFFSIGARDMYSFSNLEVL